ncbi:hypothetical protein SPRG_01042 [Saprolegnia parasitica CBS 223.65]|uniref:Na+/H+ antiporter NhaC-like C-terminal domain-containing protein n=1 Tax=Saprolegnia parasitica (strain CBS 223.65) TaxID=695850 RepID=A0A067D0D0_SAPPC|nr:hypothetical protein SPRG_01042 [Saprolegnia parasitica CBS 223.65]KDO34980.1 hypothetical protein SPRG_01042 [Saprolegnia parasitica CBS 223.65]|eukprot:XP_012194634.1 hypothetical protein SPRG_01042 [Saprolegnia parasitica CBS 223.65]
MRRGPLALLAAIVALAQGDNMTLSTPKLVLNNVPFACTLSLPALSPHGDAWPATLFVVVQVKTRHLGAFAVSTMFRSHTLGNLTVASSGLHTLYLEVVDGNGTSMGAAVTTVPSVPGFLSLLPPLLTVVVAVLCKQVLLAFVLGVWLGCVFLHAFNPLVALLRVFDTYLSHALDYRNGHAQVVTFCFLLGGLIGIVQKGGGAHGLASLVASLPATRGQALVAILTLTGLVFFDDHAAILIVGTTFSRPAQDVGVSKAKLALLIHGVSACWVSLVPISSWVGVQVGYLQGEPSLSGDAFGWFLASWPHRYFPLLWLCFLGLTVATGRDFGPMLQHERAAQRRKSRHSLSTDSETFSPLAMGLASPSVLPASALAPTIPVSSQRWYNAVLPFAAVGIGTCLGLYWDGSAHGDTSWRTVFASANSFNALIAGALAGCIVAAVLLIRQQLLTLRGILTAWLAGVAENTLSPVLVLLLAWALGHVLLDLQAAAYLAPALGSTLPPRLLPSVVTVLSFGLSVATGSAFGAMGILFPLALPLAATLSPGDTDLLTQCVGAIVGSSVFGNVLSPIADDTLLTCMATGLNVHTHVRTTLPYAAIVGSVSLFLGALPVGYGVYGPTEALGLSVSACFCLLILLGRPVVDTRCIVTDATPLLASS